MSPSRKSPKTLTISGAITLFVLVIAYACVSFINGSETPSVTPTSPAGSLVTPGSTAESWYSVYFTDPNSAAAADLSGGPDEPLADAIGQAKISLDVAVYDLDLWNIRNALIAAHQRGVAVRVVTDSDYIDNPEVEEIKDAGIPVLGDRREGLMHNKFVVIDRLEVWSGSMNYTVNDAYKNNNHVIRIRSSRLAEDYTTEFEEMFVDDLFGANDRPDTPYPSVTVEGTRIEVFFSPDDKPARRIVELVDGAQESVYFMAFSFTSNDIGEAMRARAAEGVTVAGVFEETQVASNTGDEYEPMRAAGLDVRLDGNNRNMHHKVIIIDRRIVILGSYNFSASAETKNDENLLVIDNPVIAALYLAEYERVFAEAQK